MANPQWINVDTFQTRFFQSFVNLTKANSTTYPATTAVQIEIQENCTGCAPLTTFQVYDAWALRVSAIP